MLLQFGPPHYWDRLVGAVKTPASPIPIIDCTSSVFASRKPSPPEHLSEICGGSQLEVGFKVVLLLKWWWMMMDVTLWQSRC